MEDILDDLVIIADLRMTEFRPPIPFWPESLRTLLNEESECRLKSFRFMPENSGLNGRFDWQDMREMKLPPEATERLSKALTVEMQSSSLSSSTLLRPMPWTREQTLLMLDAKDWKPDSRLWSEPGMKAVVVWAMQRSGCLPCRSLTDPDPHRLWVLLWWLTRLTSQPGSASCRCGELSRQSGHSLVWNVQRKQRACPQFVSTSFRRPEVSKHIWQVGHTASASMMVLQLDRGLNDVISGVRKVDWSRPENNGKEMIRQIVFLLIRPLWTHLRLTISYTVILWK